MPKNEGITGLECLSAVVAERESAAIESALSLHGFRSCVGVFLSSWCLIGRNESMRIAS